MNIDDVPIDIASIKYLLEQKQKEVTDRTELLGQGIASLISQLSVLQAEGEEMERQVEMMHQKMRKVCGMVTIDRDI